MKLPNPETLGLPTDKWRDEQVRALVKTQISPLKYVAHSMPTGTGKSFVGLGLAQLNQWARVGYLTATKNLQDQLKGDALLLEPAVLKGRNAYRCKGEDGWSCDEGIAGRCPFKGTMGCPHFAAWAEARSARLVVMNYHVLLFSKRYRGRSSLGDFDILICDEAGLLYDAIASSMAVTITFKDLERVALPHPEVEDIAQWRGWASMASPIVDELIEGVKETISSRQKVTKSLVEERMHLESLSSALKEVLNANPEDWTVEETEQGFKLEPIRVWRHAHRYVFHGAGKVVFLSGSLMKKHMAMLGVPNAELDFTYYDSPFDQDRSPVWWIKTGVRVDHNAAEAEIAYWVKQNDAFLTSRLDRKGVFHTTSFNLQRKVLELSSLAEHMHHNGRGDVTTHLVNRFRFAEPPAILLSPSVTTGVDLPGNQCEWTIVGKVPFPDNRRHINRCRKAYDPEYPYFVALQEVLQASMRGMRSKEDRCECVVTDDHFQWLFNRYHYLVPKWFKKLVRKADGIPPLPPKL